MNILIAPAHYVIDDESGSEYTRVFHYIDYLGRNSKIFGDVLVAYADRQTIGSLRIISFLKKKPIYISNFLRVRFILWVLYKYFTLSRKKSFDLIWHIGPFALGKTFNLIPLFNGNRTPFVVGPIPTPIDPIMDKNEFISMGKKYMEKKPLKFRMMILLDKLSAPFGTIFSKLSDATLRKSSLVIVRDVVGLQRITEKGITHVVKLTLPPNVAHVLRKQEYSLQHFTLLNVSYLIKRKRTIDLIYAMDILVHNMNCRNIHLNIAGDGVQKNNISMLIKKLKLQDYVTLLGFVPKKEVLSLYEKADIFVSASISDSMPAMYFEAMAAGLPIVMANNESAQDLRAVNFGGLVVDKESPHKIATAVEQLLQNEDLRKKFSRQNIQIMQTHYKFEHNIDQLLYNFSRLLSQEQVY